MAVLKWKDVNYNWEGEKPLFKDINLELDQNVYSLVGQNGIGKSTFMLLSSGRIHPSTGEIQLLGYNTHSLQDETQRNLLASFLYQNMEFETEDSLDKLFDQVLEFGNIESGGDELRKELITCLEIDQLLNRKLQQLSKGEMQRALLVFAVLYGSPLLFLDEPIFAMEENQKEKALEYLMDHSIKNNLSLFVSLHQLELSLKYSNKTILFHKNGSIEVGDSSMLHGKEKIEEAFQVPYSLLYQKEQLYRSHLEKPVELSKEINAKVYD